MKSIEKLSIDKLAQIVQKHRFPFAMLFGSCVDFINGNRDTEPHDIDLLVRASEINDAERLDSLSEEISSTFGIPCSIHIFEDNKPDDLVGLLALRKGVLLYDIEKQGIPSVSNEEILTARAELYNMTIGMLEKIRDLPIDNTQRIIPTSRLYHLTSIQNMVNALVRYETLEIERVEAENNIYFPEI